MQQAPISRAHEALIYKVARLVTGRACRRTPALISSYEDFLQDAAIGAMRGLRAYDPSRHAKLFTVLYTYALNDLRHAMRRNRFRALAGMKGGDHLLRRLRNSRDCGGITNFTPVELGEDHEKGQANPGTEDKNYEAFETARDAHMLTTEALATVTSLVDYRKKTGPGARGVSAERVVSDYVQRHAHGASIEELANRSGVTRQCVDQRLTRVQGFFDQWASTKKGVAW